MVTLGARAATRDRQIHFADVVADHFEDNASWMSACLPAMAYSREAFCKRWTS
jgi:hypothetical protein